MRFHVLLIFGLTLASIASSAPMSKREEQFLMVQNCIHALKTGILDMKRKFLCEALVRTFAKEQNYPIFANLVMNQEDEPSYEMESLPLDEEEEYFDEEKGKSGGSRPRGPYFYSPKGKMWRKIKF